MKKLIYFLLLVPFITFQSCLKDEEDIFDESSSARVNALIEEYREVLTAPANGWAMQYYPESNQAFGGINILVKFGEDGIATITNEGGYDENGVSSANSLYDLLAEAGPVLTFNTYNPYIHIFADPNPNLTGSIDGFKGDYEFVIVSATPEKIEMKGKKTENVIVMIALDADMTWENYLSKVYEVSDASQAPDYQLYIGTEAIGTSHDDVKFAFDWAEGEEIKTVETSFVYTPVGIKFYQPLTIKGKEIQNFTFNSTTEAFECTDGVDAKIKLVFPPLNAVLAETKSKFYLDYSEVNGTIKALWDEAKATCLAGEGETLAKVWIGYISANGKEGTGIGFITDAYQAATSVDFVPVEGTEDQVVIERTGVDLLNYSYYVAYFDTFVNFIADNSPYTIVADDEKNPTEITFTSLSNPDATFTVSK